MSNAQSPQSDLFSDGPPETHRPTPAEAFASASSRRALDLLYTAAAHYRDSTRFKAVLDFVSRFRSLHPYNAMLVQAQRPGATYAAPAETWRSQYNRLIKPGANPLVILKIFGPVAFVFDVADTELRPTPPTHPQPDLPPELTHPFEPLSGTSRGELQQTRC